MGLRPNLNVGVKRQILVAVGNLKPVAQFAGSHFTNYVTTDQFFTSLVHTFM
jgi:enamine deaminase RidA (YjgF/YER057c/UK114 family)